MRRVVVPRMQTANPKNIMNQAIIFFMTNPSFPHVPLIWEENPKSYFTYISPGIANIIKEPKSDPFKPITTSTFVCSTAIVIVERSTPIAVLQLTSRLCTYMNRRDKEWNSLTEQNSEWRLVRTAKYATGKWKTIPTPRPIRAMVGRTDSLSKLFRIFPSVWLPKSKYPLTTSQQNQTHKQETIR